MKKLLLVLSFLLWAAQADAATFWASPSGSGTTCSEEAPCSATEARSQWVGGDTIILKNGTYDITFTHSNFPSGSAGNHTTLRCENLRQCTIQVSTSAHAILFDSSSVERHYIRVQGIKFVMPNGGRAYRSGNAQVASNHIFEDNEITDNGARTQSSVYVGSQTTQSVYRRNYIHNIGSHGFYAAGSSNIFEHNRVVDYAPGPTANNARCLQFFASASPFPSNNIFRNNFCDGSGDGSIRSGAFGVYIGSGPGNQAYNNVLINLDLVFNVRSSNSKIWNNTIHNVTTAFDLAPGSGCEIRNNILLGKSTGSHAGCTISNNLTSGNASDIFQNHTTGNFALKSTATGAINQGVNVGLPFNGSAPEIGAFETLPIASASVAGNSINVTLGMNFRVPVLPASGATVFTVNNGRTVNSVERVSDSILRINFSGDACTDAQTWTFSYAPGNVTDSARVGDPNSTHTNQPLFAVTNQAVANQCAEGGGGGTGFPVVAATGHNKETSATTTHNATVPSGIASGHLLLAHLSMRAAPTVSGMPAGWAQVCRKAQPADGTVGATGEWWYKLADGTEENFTYTTSESRESITRIFRITGWDGTTAPECATDGAATVNPNPPVLAPSWGAEDTLWLAAFSRYRGNATLSGYPASYADDQFTDGTGGGSSTVMMGVASRGLQASSDDPGEFTLNNTQNWAAFTVAVRSGEGGGGAPTNLVVTQAAYQFNLLRTDPAGNPIKLPSSSSSANAPTRVPPGASIAVELQLDCGSVDPCESFGAQLQADLNESGSFELVPNSGGAIANFYGTSDSNPAILSGAPACPLTGALTCVTGATQRTADAVPNVEMVQDRSTVLRYLVKVAAAVDSTVRFRLRNQDGTPLTTYSEFPTIHVVPTFAGMQ